MAKHLAFAAIIGVAALSVAMQASAREEATEVTFNKDVLPILQKNCQSCHRPGEIAPMSFLSYKEVRPWAKAIKTAVLSRQMPPWFAEPGLSHFANDRTLSDAAIRTIHLRGDILGVREVQDASCGS